MITPSLRGGHEVTQPVHIEAAEAGDGLAIRTLDITVTSISTASGHDNSPQGFCLGDPCVAARSPTCDTVWSATHLEGIGQDAVRCDNCGNAMTPLEIVHGYTVARAAKLLGMTVPEMRNRATTNGAIEIGRAPGVIQVTFLAARQARRGRPRRLRASNTASGRDWLRRRMPVTP